MMIQYLEIKKQYPDCILFFRLGDFYEMFLEDAEIGSDILDITLTARSRGKDGKIPMAGVPFHAVDSYLAKLVSAGYKVAICDQVSEPDGKGLVEREVIRVVTPGTNLSDKSLKKKDNNYLLAIDYNNKNLVIVICDLGTGEVSYIEEESVSLVEVKQVIDDLFAKIKPVEGIVTEQFTFDQDKMNLFSNYHDFFVYSYEDWIKKTNNVTKELVKIFRVRSLKELGISNKELLLSTLGSLIHYLRFTQKVDLGHLQKLKQFDDGKYLLMDRSTISNLELLTTLNGNKKHSLIDLLDFTYTGMGGRLLKKWIVKPLHNIKEIEKRFDKVELFIKEDKLKKEIDGLLKQVADIERILSRLSLNFGNPRDLISLKSSLEACKKIGQYLDQYKQTKGFISFDKSIQKIINLIDKTIDENPPVNPKNGGFIKNGIDKQLDQLVSLTTNSRDWMSIFEKEQREKTGISSLKVKFNKVFGFYIEVSKANLHLVPDDYDRKQTLVNAERFITPELKHHEQIVLEAEEKIFAIEYQIFLKTVQKILKEVVPLQNIASQIAEIDCLVSFAKASIEYDFSRPEINKKGKIDIKAGRHPVIERIIGKHNFVPNDTLLDDKQQLVVITGPNMAGKSVLMRQTALITLLAHSGCFVPAGFAQINLTDKIFVRSGASDAITEGLSTFMVEMIETARILQHATSNSLVIMDEIGRGTSTYDGISIAWSVAEKIVTSKEVNPKTLFATHYHELQDLEKKYQNKIANYKMAIESDNNKPVFLYLFTKGEASHSFGIQVAQLAGLPEDVIKRAKQLLKDFDQELSVTDWHFLENETKSDSVESKLENEIKSLDTNNMTPVEALIKLVELQNKHGQD